MKTPETATKIVTLETLVEQRGTWRRAGRRVVWTNGCFDLLHLGHLRSLQAAAACGDVLVVGINSDASVRRLKGASRPVVPERERAERVAGLACVDWVCILDDDTPVAALARLQPEVHCKGAEYSTAGGKPMPEAEVVRAYGGEVRFLPMLAGVSTTDLVGRMGKGAVSSEQ